MSLFLCVSSQKTSRGCTEAQRDWPGDITCPDVTGQAEDVRLLWLGASDEGRPITARAFVLLLANIALIAAWRTCLPGRVPGNPSGRPLWGSFFVLTASGHTHESRGPQKTKEKYHSGSFPRVRFLAGHLVKDSPVESPTAAVGGGRLP